MFIYSYLRARRKLIDASINTIGWNVIVKSISKMYDIEVSWIDFNGWFPTIFKSTWIHCHSMESGETETRHLLIFTYTLLDLWLLAEQHWAKLNWTKNATTNVDELEFNNKSRYRRVSHNIQRLKSKSSKLFLVQC